MAITVSRSGAVACIRLDGPKGPNALTNEILAALVAEIEAGDADTAVRAIVIAGRDDVFAAGADLNALRDLGPVELYDGARAANWERLRRIRTPVIAAVSGLCLGGGCELAMLADIVVASETSRFGLPETRLGLIPGAGGTQMLPRAIGKAKAMDVVLAGRLLSATEAEAAGLISRVVSADSWLDEALALAAKVAARPAVAQRLAKESILAAAETGLTTGILAERRAFAIAFGSSDGHEGIEAFLEKRDPSWRHR